MELLPSRKTRALLAYLVITGQAHRRDRLCEMFWDMPDDPKGALRWSLSKIRSTLGAGERERLIADRETVFLDTDGADVDLHKVRAAIASGYGELDNSRLEALADSFRGELIEGLELPKRHLFFGWCMEERDAARSLNQTLLKTLIDRHDARPDAAIRFARRLVDLDPLDEDNRITLITLLKNAGKGVEARQQQRLGEDLARDFDIPVSYRLQRATSDDRPYVAAAIPADGEHAPRAWPDSNTLSDSADDPFIGRAKAMDEALAFLVGGDGSGFRILLVTGEPGIGKTRLMRHLVDQTRPRHHRVLRGTSLDCFWSRPYGPWIEAFSGQRDGSGGDTRFSDLLSRMADNPDRQGDRSSLFDTIAGHLEAWAGAGGLIVLDDVHWLDDASIDLTRHLVQSGGRANWALVMAARSGEIDDNPQLVRLLRQIRRNFAFKEITLEHLDVEEIAILTRAGESGIDPAVVHRDSGGNPLIAIEIARAQTRGSLEESRSLAALINDRLDGLPDWARDFVRWCAVFEEDIPLDHFEKLVPFDGERTADALELLERHNILGLRHHATGKTYRFNHDAIRKVVYAGVSEPRRRLMHGQFARNLGALPTAAQNHSMSIAHHAAMAGDSSLAVRACIDAGRRCLRVFANRTAMTFVNRGLHFAQHLVEAERVPLSIALLEVRLSAEEPERPEQIMTELEELAKRALDLNETDHARLAFQLLSHLRWQNCEWSEARRHALHAQLAGSAGDDHARMLALGQMALCLAMLGRDLDEADAMVMEATAIANRLGASQHMLPLSRGLLDHLAGQPEAALKKLQEARIQAQLEGERNGEFQALEELVLLSLEMNRLADARLLARDLVALGDKLRDGSEAPLARALAAIAEWRAGDEAAWSAIETALVELRRVDARHRLANVLIMIGETQLARKQTDAAYTAVDEALAAARQIERTSDVIRALVLAAHIDAARGDLESLETRRIALKSTIMDSASLPVRKAAELVLSDSFPHRKTIPMDG